MYIITLVTVPNQKTAKKIADIVLDNKLAACVNVLSGLKSYFWWQGKKDIADEILLIIKTKKGLFNKLAKTIKSIHPYDTPEIIAIPIIKGYKPYLDWIDSVTSHQE
jgi:periplasmic divalent cation tolerance protein